MNGCHPDTCCVSPHPLLPCSRWVPEVNPVRKNSEVGIQGSYKPKQRECNYALTLLRSKSQYIFSASGKGR